MHARQVSHYGACSSSAPSSTHLVGVRRSIRCFSSSIKAPTPKTPQPHTRKLLQQTPVAGAVLGLATLAILHPQAAEALTIHTEPANALSLPTWAIHVSSVTEWIAAMALMWRYADVSGNQRWKGMAWGMMPCLGSAMAACTWHFFYNSPDLDFLVAVQALLTVIGNCTCWYAAYRIFEAAQAQKAI